MTAATAQQAQAWPTTVHSAHSEWADIPLLQRAPLLPLALSATLGIVVERVVDAPTDLRIAGLELGIGILILLVLLTGCAGLAANRRQNVRRSLLQLCLLSCLLAAAWHRLWHLPYENDIGHRAADEPRLARVRGVVLQLGHEYTPASPLRSLPAQTETTLLLGVSAVQVEAGWRDARGRVKAWIGEFTAAPQVGTEIELLGQMQRPLGPPNPGEPDIAAYFRDQGVRALLFVKTADAVQVRQPAPWWSPGAGLARLRAWGNEQLADRLPPAQARVAQALILGEQTALDPRQFEAYQRTGVFHVLAISGQHVVILCGVLWLLLRLLGVPRRTQALLMLALVIGYCVLTGSRPPMVRAATVVAALCGAVLLGRRSQPLNSLALAWLVTIILNPADIFQTGCQISYLAVLVLFQVVIPWERSVATATDPLQTLIAASRPLWQRVLRQVGSWFSWLMLVNVILALACAPLLAGRYHLVSPVAILLTPPLLVLTSVALVAGFLLLLLAPLGPAVQAVFSALIEWSLLGAEGCVALGELLPGAFWYTRGPPEWCLWLFYVPFLAWILWPRLRQRWKLGLVAASVWLALVLTLTLHRPVDPALRCTFLAVGHGGCVVIEAPDGRVLLYDVGSLGGPELTARHLAPFLWHRGIERIDEVFVSHADLDHFNGLPALLDRFEVTQVSLTPTFQEKTTPAVDATLRELKRRAVPVRILSRGQRLEAGRVDLVVLHPPPRGPEGSENARSLVLLVTYAGHSLLLTGDLEEPGLTEVIRLPRPRVDVLLAPHHGSRFSNTEAFASWAKPGLAISSEGRARGPRVDPYSPTGATVWRTWQEGAVTIIMDDNGIRAETFRTQRTWSR